MDEGPEAGPFLGRSEPLIRMLERLGRAAATRVSVLLTGETGTGKSHLARHVHERSTRHQGPFVSVNCAGVPDGLFESELFGHRRGAFTGAIESRVGLFEQASTGTLFLDELGELPPAQQAKLLTAIEERRVRPVGSTTDRRIDVRLVSATSRDLVRAIENGRFRADLFHRVAVVRCEIPPLRDRPEDLPPIARHLLVRLAARYHRPELRLAPDAWPVLAEHPWPGNVRELAHVLEAAAVLTPARTLGASDLRPLLTTVASAPATSAGSRDRYSFHGSEDEERELILGALERTRGNRTRAARELGMARNTLRARLRKFGLA